MSFAAAVAARTSLEAGGVPCRASGVPVRGSAMMPRLPRGRPDRRAARAPVALGQLPPVKNEGCRFLADTFANVQNFLRNFYTSSQNVFKNTSVMHRAATVLNEFNYTVRQMKIYVQD